MRLSVALSGAVGLGLAIILYASAEWLSGRVSVFIDNRVFSVVLFAGLALVALVEIPAMSYALKSLLNTSRSGKILVPMLNVTFVSFAAVYAMIYLLATHDPIGGRVLAATCILRFVSGGWIK